MVLLFALEISNIPIYIVYHLLQLNKLYPEDNSIKQTINYAKIIQLVVYGNIRTFYIPYYFYNNYGNFEYFILLFVFLFYILGFYWTGLLCKGYYNENYILKKIY